ncbi:MAG TPA: hypothetical protein PKE55_00530 [Kiritimatiellia bacterium]|nr:hypothetical protein [Kiritimatiellia bacterium]
MSSDPSFDFWYAINHSEVVVKPRKILETFGSTTIEYTLVSELMDDVQRIRIREGKITAFRPAILTPEDLAGAILEGFQEAEAERYLQWLRQHQEDLVLLKYGFRIRMETVNEHLVTDALDTVVERIAGELKAKDAPMTALIRGVDEPWQVCLLRLLSEVVQQSALSHADALKRDPLGHRQEIETAFHRAAKDSNQVSPLATLLQRTQLFKEYEDRFYALVRGHRGG